jgi:hypothetical protein
VRVLLVPLHTNSSVCYSLILRTYVSTPCPGIACSLFLSFFSLLPNFRRRRRSGEAGWLAYRGRNTFDHDGTRRLWTMRL